MSVTTDSTDEKPVLSTYWTQGLIEQNVTTMAITDTTEPFDESTKTFYRHLFEEWGLKVESEYEVFTRSRTIDLVVEVTEPNNPHLAESVFAYFRRWNILELKGIHDPLTGTQL